MSIEQSIIPDEEGRLIRSMYERNGEKSHLIFGSVIEECYQKAVAENRVKDEIFRQLAQRHYNARGCNECSGFEKRECYVE